MACPGVSAIIGPCCCAFCTGYGTGCGDWTDCNSCRNWFASMVTPTSIAGAAAAGADPRDLSAPVLSLVDMICWFIVQYSVNRAVGVCKTIFTTMYVRTVPY